MGKCICGNTKAYFDAISNCHRCSVCHLPVVVERVSLVFRENYLLKESLNKT